MIKNQMLTPRQSFEHADTTVKRGGKTCERYNFIATQPRFKYSRGGIRNCGNINRRSNVLSLGKILNCTLVNVFDAETGYAHVHLL